MPTNDKPAPDSGATDSLLNEITVEIDRPVHWKDFVSCIPTVTILIVTGVLCFTLIPYVFTQAWNAMIEDSRIYALREQYELPEDEPIPKDILETTFE